jgi:hypothetical protein
MKRFRAWLFKGLISLSAGMCVTSIVLWLGSYSVAHAAWFQSKTGCFAYAVTTKSYLILAAGRASGMDFTYEWKSGLFVDSYDQRSLYKDFGLQEGGTVYSHLGLVAVTVYGPVMQFSEDLKTFGKDSPGEDWPMAHAIYLPLWLFGILFAVAPARFFYNIIQRYQQARCAERIAKRMCVSCGYDLRATPDRCPECGTVPQKTT